MNLRNQIENTDTFKKMEQYKKNIYQSGKNIKHITDQYIIAQSIGYEAWKKDHNPASVEDKIIIDLFAHDLQKTPEGA